MNVDQQRKRRISWIVIGYPFALIAVALVGNLFVFGVEPATIALPAKVIMLTWAIAIAALCVNHIWLMTGTELTRLKFDLFATPEEWEAKGRLPTSASERGTQELQRHQNAHRNATENVVYFALASSAFVLVSPSVLAFQIWIVGFVIGRLGHTLSYLCGKDDLRGLFMSLSLLSLFGAISYPVISLLG